MANQLFKDWDNFNFLHLKFQPTVSDELLVNIARASWQCCSCLALSSPPGSYKVQSNFIHLLGQDSKLWHYCHCLSSFSPDRCTFPIFSQKQSWRSASFIAFQGKNQNYLITKVIWEKSHKSMQVMALWSPPWYWIHRLWNDPEIY